MISENLSKGRIQWCMSLCHFYTWRDLDATYVFLILRLYCCLRVCVSAFVCVIKYLPAAFHIVWKSIIHKLAWNGEMRHFGQFSKMLWSTSKQKTTRRAAARDKFNFHPRLLHWTAAASNKTLTIWPSLWFFSFRKDFGKAYIEVVLYYLENLLNIEMIGCALYPPRIILHDVILFFESAISLLNRNFLKAYFQIFERYLTQAWKSLLCDDKIHLFHESSFIITTKAKDMNCRKAANYEPT